ncbi:MAG: hypothetical protein LBH39_01650 [Clostridiales Family XIII bacterium]|nr:hypothetical protein [Clostridiales Family XIII bacterium]
MGNENNGANKTANPDWTATDIKMVEILGKIREAHPDFLMGEQIDIVWDGLETIQYEEGFVEGEYGGGRKKSRAGGAAAIIAVVLIFAVAAVLFDIGKIGELKLGTGNIWREAKGFLAQSGKNPDTAGYMIAGDSAKLTISSMDQINVAKNFLPSLTVPGALPEGFGMESITIEKNGDGMYSVDYVYKDSRPASIYMSCMKLTAEDAGGGKGGKAAALARGAGSGGAAADARAGGGAGQGGAAADAKAGGGDGPVNYEIKIPDGVVAVISDIGGVPVYTCDDGQMRAAQFVLGSELFWIGAAPGSADEAVDSLAATLIASRQDG